MQIRYIYIRVFFKDTLLEPEPLFQEGCGQRSDPVPVLFFYPDTDEDPVHLIPDPKLSLF